MLSKQSKKEVGILNKPVAREGIKKVSEYYSLHEGHYPRSFHLRWAYGNNNNGLFLLECLGELFPKYLNCSR